MDTDELSAALTGTVAVLFDFDGPVVDVFVGESAKQVKTDLIALAATSEPALLGKLSDAHDFLEVLRLTHEFDTEIGLEVERALTAAEVEAVEIAGDPTPGAIAALEAARASGRKVAVVSNNSAASVQAFLDRHGLAGHVQAVVGRPEERPELMKPNPHSLIKAAELLGVEVTLCVLIGDSLTDIQGAHAAGCAAIGYANKAPKRDLFAAAGAEAITESMQAIAAAIRSQPDN
ncbi:HAD family hydrolase [Streptomyces sp. NPDC057136]|uniref:HAD family hydrolase n=1 Tax=Streptomyces sp. NPDC057136 TaxID=3346029 RepID=UPI003639A83B